MTIVASAVVLDDICTSLIRAVSAVGDVVAVVDSHTASGACAWGSRRGVG
jgi:hypothetical protein